MPNQSNGSEAVYQTLADFYFHPFGDSYRVIGERLDPKYEKYKSQITLNGYSILDESYYLHVKIPSESQPGKKYDVVIQFISPDDKYKNSTMLDEYVIQFFSNSPSFIYRYAVIYKQMGYMIDALQGKMDPEYSDKAPSKTNADMKIGIDKSIYFAVKFLYENRVTYLSKSSLRFLRKMNFKELVRSIDDNKTSLEKSAYDIEQEAIKEGRVDKKKIERNLDKIFPSKKDKKKKNLYLSSPDIERKDTIRKKVTSNPKRPKIKPTKTTVRKK